MGFVLVIAMVLLGAAAVVALGATAIADTDSQLSEDRAEKALTQFDSKAGLVALGESSSQEVNFPTDGSNDFSVDSQAGWMKIEVENATGDGVPEWLENRPDKEDGVLLNSTLGEVAYQKDDSKLAYQGGGVFRATQSGGVMISPPEFHYRAGTLTLPIVNVTSDGNVGSGTLITKGETSQVFPNPAVVPESVNPLEDRKVTITVQSEYYEGWATYFDQRTESTVERIPEEEKVRVTLTTPFDQIPVESSITMTSPGKFSIEGFGSVDKTTKSYDSREGTFEETKGNKGDIIATGTVDLGGNIYINGSVHSEEGDVECRGNPEIAGYTIAEEGTAECDGNQESGPPDVNIDGGLTDLGIETFVTETKDDNDNDNSDAIEDNELDLNSNEKITAGEYYIERFEMSGNEELELDTSSGDINIAVEEFLEMDNGAEITITGDGHVGLWMNGSETIDVNVMDVQESHFHLAGNDISITTDKDREYATQFSVWGKSDFKASIDNPGSGYTEIHGMIYAPGDDSEIAILFGDIYGGLVAGSVELDQSSVLFDKALSDEENLPEGPDILSITYLHVTENQIAVEG